MRPRDNDELEAVMSESGVSLEKGRRLSDKILIAFNHAYASGEAEVAKRLKTALKVSLNESPFREMRKHYDPLGAADLWEKFVDARDAYRTARESLGDVSEDLAALSGEMKDAYLDWSRA